MVQQSNTGRLETAEQVFCITSNGSPSKADLKQVENGATLLKLTSSGTVVDVERYTPGGFWNSLTGGWTREAKRTPVASWSEIGEKLSTGWSKITNTDWSKVGDALQITTGILGVEIFGGAAALGILSPLTGSAAGLAWGWMVKGWYNISDGQIYLDPMNGLYIPW